MTKKYISLFSSAGIGCYNLPKNNFECIATNELLEKRMNIQKINKKCQYDDQYVTGSITEDNIKAKISGLVNKYSTNDLDLIIATPPCQGMSLINQKKGNELSRNSLVIESLLIIAKHKPKFFILENVRSFLKTQCTYKNKLLKINEAITKILEKHYNFDSKIINFADFGSNSSRTRALVIGVRKDMNIPPSFLFPNQAKRKSIKNLIAKLPSLITMGQIDKNDILHNFKAYEPKMRYWIENLRPGESAFDNKDKSRYPHRIINGVWTPNSKKTGDKYKRQKWESVAPCVHTRNDILASQNTIHPIDDRVFSIREISIFQTIPKSFRWFNQSYNKINKLNYEQKTLLLKQNEFNIRTCIGESVPPVIFESITKKINFYEKYINNIMQLEKNNMRRKELSAYYTSPELLVYVHDALPEFANKKELNILEPSVGAGALLLPLIEKYPNKKLNIYINDIDGDILSALDRKSLNQFKNVNLISSVSDYLQKSFNIKFDLILCNPPFEKENIINFFNKSISEANHLLYIMPKYILSSGIHKNLRYRIEKYKVSKIYDLGSKGFKDAKIETLIFSISNFSPKDSIVEVYNINKNILLRQKQSYIFNKELPTWILYRNKFFDKTFKKLDKVIMDVHRDRTITKKHFVNKSKTSIPLLKPSNLIGNHFITKDVKYVKNIKSNTINNFLEQEYIVVPNMTYNIRCGLKPKNYIVDGSMAILTTSRKIKKSEMKKWLSDDFREYYAIIHSYARRTININKDIIYYLGF